MPLYLQFSSLRASPRVITIITILSALFAQAARALYFIYVRSFAVHVPQSRCAAPFIYFTSDIYGNRHSLFYRENSPARLTTPSARHKSRRLDLLFRDLRQSKKCRRPPGRRGPKVRAVIDKAAVNLVGRFRYSSHNWAQRAKWTRARGPL